MRPPLGIRKERFQRGAQEGFSLDLRVVLRYGGLVLERTTTKLLISRMKPAFRFLLAFSVLLATPQAWAQFGSADSAAPVPGGGTPITEPIAKLFASFSGFSCDLDVTGKDPSSKKPFAMSGKLAFMDLKSRFELDLARVKGGGIDDSMKAQVASMGLGQMVMIARPDKNATYVIYPGLESYVLLSQPKPDGPAARESTSDQLSISPVGKETINGHPCIKNKYTFKDSAGKTQEAMVWNATDLKQFPIRIDHNESNQPIRLDFKNVDLSKPAESAFSPPASYSKYGTMATLMQNAVMKKLGGQLPIPGN